MRAAFEIIPYRTMVRERGKGIRSFLSTSYKILDFLTFFCHKILQKQMTAPLLTFRLALMTSEQVWYVT